MEKKGWCLSVRHLAMTLTFKLMPKLYSYFEDNAGVIVNPKGEMKGSAIAGLS